MSWYDYVPSVPFQIGNALVGNGNFFGMDPNGRSGTPQMGQNPYNGDWKSLIGQLQNQANPNYTGPSVAGNAYKQAAGDQMNAAQSMAAGGSAGGARQAQMMMGRTGQGLSQGYAAARTQEMQGAQQQLQGALGGAGQAWFGPASQNFQAQLSTPSNMQKLMAFLQQMGPIAGAMGA